MKHLILIFALIASTLSFSQTKSINIDYTATAGTGKKMTGVNTGPHSIISGTTQACLQSIGTELVRTHDYHGACDYWNYTDFFDYPNQTFNYSFQPQDTSAYNWAVTDAQISEIVNANLQPFFRLGISFPGGGFSPASPLPKDADGYNFHTFAGIAKRTAMHYTAGWDNGFTHTIPYWEIWNEPNNNASWAHDSIAAYYRLYKECVDSIKSFNPQLKVGGPAAAKSAFYTGGIHYTLNPDFISNFLSFCQTNALPLDFYSFHMYDKPNPYNVRILTDTLAHYLDQYGYTNTELIISETNINTGGYDNTAKGCSYLASELISVANSRLNKFIWYRGVDLNPLCNADNGSSASLTLNGYAYKFYNELNDSTPSFLATSSNEFNGGNLMDSLNNVMVLAGKNTSDSEVKVMISNHESGYTDMNISLQNLPWTASDQISITIDKVTSNGYSTATTAATGGTNMNVAIPSVTDASTFLVTLKKEFITSTNNFSKSANSNFFPNPAENKVWIKTNSKNFTVRLTTIEGRTLITSTNKLELDLKDTPSGIYFISIADEGGIIEKSKLVITK